MNKTSIEWTEYTFNPITGCLHGCTYCYAAAISKRFKRSFKPEFHPERLGQPEKVKRPSKIFVGSMADVFGAWVPDEWIWKIFDVCILNHKHTFQFLTKNPERMQDFNWPANCWAGATATNRSQMERAQSLEYCNAPVKFISAEPLLDSIRFSTERHWRPGWLIIGAQTGPGSKPINMDWVARIVADAVYLDIPLFVKGSVDGYDIFKDYPRID